MSIPELAILCSVGFFAGVFGGMLGIGGSIVLIPALTEVFGPRQHLYQAAAMIVNFFVVVPACYQHVRAGAVMAVVVRRMIPVAMISVMGGVLLSELFRGQGQAYLVILFGIFLLYLAVQNLLLLVGRRGQHERREPFDAGRDGWKAALWAGTPTGLVAGLLGVGGGVVCVPLQSRFLGIPLRSAIANSSATIIGLSFIGAIGKNYALAEHHPEHTLGESIALAGAVVPTAIVGSLIGSRLTHLLPVGVVRAVLLVFLVTAGVRMAHLGVARVVEKPAPAAPAILSPVD